MDPELVYQRTKKAIELDSEIASKVFTAIFALDSCQMEEETLPIWSLKKVSGLSKTEILEGLNTLQRLRLLKFERINGALLRLVFTGGDLRGVLYILRSRIFKGGLEKGTLQNPQDPQREKKRKRVLKNHRQSLDSATDFVEDLFGDTDGARGRDGKVSKRIPETTLTQFPSLRPEIASWNRREVEQWTVWNFIGYYLSLYSKIYDREDTVLMVSKKNLKPVMYRLLRFARTHFPPPEGKDKGRGEKVSQKGSEELTGNKFSYDKGRLRDYITWVTEWVQTPSADFMDSFTFFHAFNPGKPFFVNLFNEYESGRGNTRRTDRNCQSREKWLKKLKA